MPNDRPALRLNRGERRGSEEAEAQGGGDAVQQPLSCGGQGPETEGRARARAKEGARASAQGPRGGAVGLWLFAAAVGALPRRGADPRGRASAPPPPKAAELPLRDEDTEALGELAALVGGDAIFDISDSTEFIEGCVEGLDRKVLRKLKRGEFDVAAKLDLHGLRREPAREAVLDFITRCQRDQKRCVLIVTGRGKGSEDQIPVLKNLLKLWLERGPIAKKILAFSTARPHDGGTGALYVLLRK